MIWTCKESPEITLYTEDTYYMRDSKLHLVGFIINDEPNTFYSVNGNNPINNQIKTIKLEMYLLEYYKNQAKEKLQKYLETNIDIYLPPEEVCYSAGKEPNLSINDLRIDLSDLGNGIVKTTRNSYSSEYNFITKASTPFHSSRLGEGKILNIFFNEHILKQLLCCEQLKRNQATPIIRESFKINQFLIGKSSLKTVMKDGSIYSLKLTYGNIRDIIFISRNNKTNKLETSSIPSGRPVAEINFLQYGKEKFYFDTEAFRV